MSLKTRACFDLVATTAVRTTLQQADNFKKVLICGFLCTTDLGEGDATFGDLDGKPAANSGLFLLRDGVSVAAASFLGLRHRAAASFDLGLAAALATRALSASTSALRCSARLATLLSMPRILSATTRTSAFNSDDDFAAADDLSCFLGVNADGGGLDRTFETAPDVFLGVSTALALCGGVTFDLGARLAAAAAFLGVALSRLPPLRSIAGLSNCSALNSLLRCCCRGVSLALAAFLSSCSTECNVSVCHTI